MTVPASAANSSGSGHKVSATALLKQIPVRPTSHTGSYDRDDFTLWITQKDGCDTRDLVLIEQSLTKVSASDSCALYGGTWKSRYDGVTTTDYATFDIDHVVPLAEAWASDGWKWSARTRTAYANDLGYAGSLLAVTASSNRTKVASDPAEWMPADNRCAYVADWTAVKERWGLTMDTAERTAISRIMARCSTASLMVAKPGTPKVGKLAAGRGSSIVVRHHASGSGGTTTGGAASATATPTPTGTYYQNCDAVRSAGAAPIHRGDPGYATWLDRDGDGVGCE